MRTHFFPQRRTFLLILLLVGSLLLISFQVRDRSGMTYFAKGALAILAPVQTATVSAVRAIGALWEGYLALGGVRSENERLRREVEELRCEVRLMQEEIQRGGRMEEFRIYQREARLSGLVARVIGESPDPWIKSIFIDKGTRNGLRRGLPVVTPGGIVGRVLTPGEGSSVVLLVTDRSSDVPVLVSASRSRAILEGENAGTCELKFLDRIADVKVGDAVVTSGLGDVFPPGLQVGTVSQVVKRSYGLYQYAKVIPSVPIARLESVLVLQGGQGEHAR